MREPEKLRGCNTDILEWITCIMEIPGNKEADKLAKEGTNDQTIGIPFVASKEVLIESFETGAPEEVEDL